MRENIVYCLIKKTGSHKYFQILHENNEYGIDKRLYKLSYARVSPLMESMLMIFNVLNQGVQQNE